MATALPIPRKKRGQKPRREPTPTQLDKIEITLAKIIALIKTLSADVAVMEQAIEKRFGDALVRGVDAAKERHAALESMIREGQAPMDDALARLPGGIGEGGQEGKGRKDQV